MLNSDQDSQESLFRKTILALRLPFFLLLLFCETICLVYLAPTDVTRYHCYALTFWYGSQATEWLSANQCAFLKVSSLQPAFHLLPLEYPPLTLLLFSIPLVAPLPYYSLTFALCMLLIAGVIYWCFVRFHSKRAARLFILYLSLGATFLVQIRFDLLPAACMLICLIAAERKRWGIAYGALAVGVLFKLYPIVALPALFIAEQEVNCDLRFSFSKIDAESSSHWRHILRPVLRWRWKHISLFSGILVGVTGCFAVLNQAAILGPMNYLLQRPTQIESMESSFLWLAQFVGTPFQLVFSYGSLNIVSPLASLVAWIGLSACLLGGLFIFSLQWLYKLPLGQAMIALLCLLIITGKVFSPQYLIWLIPLIAYVGASRKWLYSWGVVSLLTTGVYLFYYSHLPDPAAAPKIIQSLPGFFETILIRNVIFLFMTLAYLFNWFQARQPHSSGEAKASNILSPVIALPGFVRSEPFSQL